MRSLTILLGSLLIPLQFSLAEAQIRIYETILGDFENPPTGSPGTGMARLTFDLTGSPTMRVEAQFSGLLGNTTVAHVHCCVDPPGNVGVATSTPTFPGFPAGVTSGSYDMTFDMTQGSSYNPAFVTVNGGTTASALAALLAGLDAGRAYFNVHTNRHPGGEIRGFFTYIPEPNAAILAGYAAVTFLLRRRR